MFPLTAPPPFPPNFIAFIGTVRPAAGETSSRGWVLADTPGPSVLKAKLRGEAKRRSEDRNIPTVLLSG